MPPWPPVSPLTEANVTLRDGRVAATTRASSISAAVPESCARARRGRRRRGRPRRRAGRRGALPGLLGEDRHELAVAVGRRGVDRRGAARARRAARRAARRRRARRARVSAAPPAGRSGYSRGEPRRAGARRARRRTRRPSSVVRERARTVLQRERDDDQRQQDGQQCGPVDARIEHRRRSVVGQMDPYPWPDMADRPPRILLVDDEQSIQHAPLVPAAQGRVRGRAPRPTARRRSTASARRRSTSSCST